jgi:tektin-4
LYRRIPLEFYVKMATETESSAYAVSKTSFHGNMGNGSGVSTVGYRVGKYTPAEWEESNYQKYYQAMTDKDTAQQTYNNSWSVIRDTDAITEKNQAQSTQKLRERLHDINFWKQELEREIVDVIDEVELLKKQKKRLENALMATECPLHIVTDNLNCRNRRYGGERVDDDVEKALLKEIDVINKVQDLYKRTLDQVDKQLARNYHVKDQLEFDWSDKKEADEYDSVSANLTNGNTNKQFYPGAARYQEIMSDPIKWAQFSADNIAASERERVASNRLRALVDNIIHDTVKDMREAADNTEVQFQKNVDRLYEAKSRLEDHLKKTVTEIENTEKLIENLKAAIRRKDDPLKVAQTRLHNRSFRPGVELCKDEPQHKLISEVGDIGDSLDRLIHQLSDSENALKNLSDTRMVLEKEIQSKKDAIFIDKEKCVPHRTRYPSTVKLQGYNNY